MRRPLGLIVLVVLLSASVHSQQPPKHDWTILCGDNAGGIGSSDTRASLVQKFGAENVRDGEVEAGEGTTEPGTIVFAGDPKRQVEIMWIDPNTKRHIHAVSVSDAGTVWRTYSGITVGTTIERLEELNGRAFRMGEFEGEFVTSWRRGHLEQVLGTWENKSRRCWINISVDPDEHRVEALTKAELISVQQNFLSSNPAVRKAGYHVSDFTMATRTH